VSPACGMLRVESRWMYKSAFWYNGAHSVESHMANTSASYR
jgi:hypothetical protein